MAYDKELRENLDKIHPSIFRIIPELLNLYIQLMLVILIPNRIYRDTIVLHTFDWVLTLLIILLSIFIIWSRKKVLTQIKNYFYISKTISVLIVTLLELIISCLFVIFNLFNNISGQFFSFLVWIILIIINLVISFFQEKLREELNIVKSFQIRRNKLLDLILEKDANISEYIFSNETDIKFLSFWDTSFVSLASISAIQHERCIDFLKGLDSETKDMIVFKVKERLDSKPPIDISKYYKFFPLLILLVGTTTFTKVGVIILSVFNISIQMFRYSLFFFALLLIGIVIQDSLSKHSDDDTYKYILMLIDRSYRSGD